MDVLTKTKELCEALTDSPEFKELARTETILKHDPDAQDLIKRFNEAQNYLHNLYTTGKKAAAEDFAKLRKIESEMEEDASTGPYLKAQQSFSDLMTKINQMINEAIQQPGTSTGHCNCGKHH